MKVRVGQFLGDLMPIIVGQVKEALKRDSSPELPKNGKVMHAARCRGCGSSPIYGVRYKCM
jgi:hypothetical protein